jgi:hypothetical protein
MGLLMVSSLEFAELSSIAGHDVQLVQGIVLRPC